jgi:hypothetical protein
VLKHIISFGLFVLFHFISYYGDFDIISLIMDMFRDNYYIYENLCRAYKKRQFVRYFPNNYFISNDEFCSVTETGVCRHEILRFLDSGGAALALGGGVLIGDALYHNSHL